MKKIAALLILILTVPPQLSATLTGKGLDKNAYTTDFMMGNVVVSIIFAESNGQSDPNLENWSEERKTQVISQIMAGLDWWTKQNTRSPLSFTFLTQTVATKYEPISRPYSDESKWIPDVMGKLGFQGSRFTAVRNYDNQIRQDNHADWAFTIFMVDSLNDSNGKFADGYFAYSYLGGPFTVMTYDNNGYGISNMAVVAAHETGHIFNALDEYAGASSPGQYSAGYFPTINGNHVYSSTMNEPNSIMQGGLRWGLDEWARKMVGWRDSDGNNRDDIMDGAPEATISSQGNIGGSSGTGFSGDAEVKILPRQNNSQGYGFTLDTIAKIEYRLPSGEWSEASPTDGLFDSAQEAFQIVVSQADISSLSLTAQEVELRISTNYSQRTGNVTRSAAASSTLDNAHAFPNPFKPNSGLGHTEVTFTGLTANAKLQVFTPAGEPVITKEAAVGASEIPWDAYNDDGKAVTSGVYYYLITDTAGHKKKGKIAVIR